jgi:two-component system sensor histidine kinase KdpD
MKFINTTQQVLATLIVIIIITALMFLLLPFLGYRAVGLIYLVGILLLSTIVGRRALLLNAVLSTILWNYLFIPPRFTFAILESEDLMMVFSFFFAAIVCGILTARIKKQQSELNKLKLKEASKKLHDTLLNSVSHELRTPLTVLIGATSALKEINIYSQEEARETLTDEIIQSAQRLNNVVNNLLDVTRIESGDVRLKLEWFSWEELFNKVLAETQESERVSINIEGDIHLNIYGDFVLLTHAFNNLISNTVKHSGHQISQVFIDVKKEKGTYNISYRDNGVGVLESQLEDVFEKFYKSSESKTGIGLGLSIVRSIVELHEGEIKCLPSAEGIYFKIRIPEGSSLARMP